MVGEVSLTAQASLAAIPMFLPDPELTPIPGGMNLWLT